MGAAHGATLPGFYNAPAATFDAFTKLTGRPPKIVHVYAHWGDDAWGLSKFPTSMVEAIATRGAAPLVTWDMMDWYGSMPASTQSHLHPDTVLQGRHDAKIREFARGAKAFGKPVLVRYLHEFNHNGGWVYEMSRHGPEKVKALFRYVVDFCRREGATNIKWLWCPIPFSSAELSQIRQAFPGVSRVDFLGSDGYNGGTAVNWGGWQSFTKIFKYSYDQLLTLAARPLVIAEWGSAEQGGDKAAWIRSMFLQEMPNSFPKIAGVVAFNEDYRPQGQADWRINTSSASLNAYKECIASPYWQFDLNLSTPTPPPTSKLNLDLAIQRAKETVAELERLKASQG